MDTEPREPQVIKPDDINPRFNWDRAIPAPGHSGVDFEERVNFQRLHNYRLARARAALSAQEASAKPADTLPKEGFEHVDA